jgi:hypothetical protein
MLASVVPGENASNAPRTDSANSFTKDSVPEDPVLTDPPSFDDEPSFDDGPSFVLGKNGTDPLRKTSDMSDSGASLTSRLGVGKKPSKQPGKIQAARQVAQGLRSCHAVISSRLLSLKKWIDDADEEEKLIRKVYRDMSKIFPSEHFPELDSRSSELEPLWESGPHPRREFGPWSLGRPAANAHAASQGWSRQKSRELGPKSSPTLGQKSSPKLGPSLSEAGDKIKPLPFQRSAVRSGTTNSVIPSLALSALRPFQRSSTWYQRHRCPRCALSSAPPPRRVRTTSW